MKISFKPYGDYVVLSPTNYATEIGGITLQTSDVAKTPKAIVMAHGNKKQYVEEGVEVLYRKFNESPLTLPEGDFIILREENIYGEL